MENKELIEIIEENIKAYHYSQVDDSRSKSLEVARDTIIAAINQHIYKEVVGARIDELERLKKHYSLTIYGFNKKKYAEDRIEMLKKDSEQQLRKNGARNE